MECIGGGRGEGEGKEGQGFIHWLFILNPGLSSPLSFQRQVELSKGNSNAFYLSYQK